MIFRTSPARLQDLNALRRLIKEVFKEDAWPVLDLLTALIFPGGIHIKAHTGDTLVGFISVEENFFESCAWVSLVGVASEFRRQGIGESLMKEIEKLVRRPVIQLCVRRSNQAAIHLYEKLGYQKKEIRQRYYSDGEDALVMGKRINSPSDH